MILDVFALYGGTPYYHQVTDSFQTSFTQLNTEVFSFQGVGIEGISLYTEVSSFQGV